MRSALIQTFEPEARYSNDIVKLRKFKFNASETAASITKAWSVWKRVMNGDKESDAVEAIIGCIDEYLRLRLITSKCKTVPELISVASTMKLKESRTDEPPAKRPRIRLSRAENLACFKCGKIGHIQSNYREKEIAPLLTHTATDPEKARFEKARTICSYCKKSGHVRENCFKRRANESRKINLAAYEDTIPTPMTVYFGDRIFVSLFDSGANRSLIRRSVSIIVHGKREDFTLVLQVLGTGSPLTSYQRVLISCRIDTVLVEIYFHVVEDHEIPCDLLVGTDLAKTPGLAVQVTNKGAFVLRTSITMVASVGNKDPVIELDTDLSDNEDLLKLRLLLDKHQDFFYDWSTKN